MKGVGWEPVAAFVGWEPVPADADLDADDVEGMESGDGAVGGRY